MSEVAQEHNVEKLSSLCKEYAQVLTNMRGEIEALSRPLTNLADRRYLSPALYELAGVKLSAIQSRFNRLKPGLEQLIRVASQLVEHSRAGKSLFRSKLPTTNDWPQDYDGLALRLRLADLEGSLLQTEQMLSQSQAAATR